MVLAMMAKTRLWLGGEVSDSATWPDPVAERAGEASAARRPLLICMDGLVSYIRAIREAFRDPVHTGQGGRPRLRPWHNILIAQVVKRYERWRLVEMEPPIIDGIPARVETLRRRSQGDDLINTAYIERLNATFRIRFASLTRRSRALAWYTLTLHHSRYLIGTASNFCTLHASLVPAGGKTTPAMAAGTTDHGWSVHEFCRITCLRLVGGHPCSAGGPHKHLSA
jgi:hypothetical protein